MIRLAIGFWNVTIEMGSQIIQEYRWWKRKDRNQPHVPAMFKFKHWSHCEMWQQSHVRNIKIWILTICYLFVLLNTTVIVIYNTEITRQYFKLHEFWFSIWMDTTAHVHLLQRQLFIGINPGLSIRGGARYFYLPKIGLWYLSYTFILFVS